MHASDKGETACPGVREILERRIRDNRVELRKLMKFNQILEDTFKEWTAMSNSVPDGNSVYRLIVSLGRSTNRSELIH